MWLFGTEPLLTAKNDINGHSLYVLYDILCPCNQCFRVKVPVNHNITYSIKADMLTHVLPKHTLFHLIRWLG